MKQFKTISLNQVLIAVLTILALAMGQTAMAGNDWSVTNPTGSKFRITRPDSHVGTTETVEYRTVNLSAYAGQHYTAMYGEVTFGSEDTYKEVTVPERTPDVDAYKYQTGDKRKYRFDVTDMGGFPLAHCDREITTGTSVADTDVFNIKDVTIQASEYTADDRGYDNNGYKSVGASSFCTSGTQAYLSFLNAQLRMTLSFQAKENDDAFEYLQILFDNIKTCDNRSGASDGNPGTPSLSSYMAGFEMDTKKKDADYKSYTFPVTSVGDNASATNPWGHGEQWPLKNQKFKSGSRATDGRLIVPTDFSTLVLRLNASGGSGSDEWAARNVKAHIQAVDNTAPTKLAIVVDPGRHSWGNTVYVSIAFSEIVTISGTTKQLHTTWGNLNYVEGSGTNVLTFSGEFSTTNQSGIHITGLTGTVQDFAGHGFTWSGDEMLTALNPNPSGAHNYTITYDLDGGSVATANPSTYTYRTETFTLNNPTRTGYTFDGWTGSNGNTPSTSVQIAQYSHGDKSFTANWTPNQYAVTFNMQGGNGGSVSTTATYDAAMPAITVPTRTGYTFGGYYFGTNGYGTKYYNADGTSANNWNIAYDATLYAKWTANEYTVTLDMQGGDSGSTAATATYDAAMPAITVPTRTGYIFCGYYTEPNGGGTQYYYADGTSANNWDIADVTTLYAQWTNPTGTCGSSTTWEYNHATTTLSISGSGSTGDYNLDTQPWKDYREYITAVSISDDITHIGEGAFNSFSELTSVSGGNGVTSIGSHAFYNAKWYRTAKDANAITYLGHVLVCGRGYNEGNVVVADGTTAIYEDAFYNNWNITSVTIPDGVTSIGRQAFYNCSNLATVNVLGSTPPTLDSQVFDDYIKNSRTFNVRNASYKTTGRWADIYNKENDYSGYDNFTLRVVSTLSLPNGVTVSVADGDKVTILGTDYYVEGADVTLSGLGTEHTDGDVTYRSRATVSYNSDQTLTADADPSTGQAIFTMPAADASVIVADYPYAVKYIDADGTEQTCYNPTAIQSSDEGVDYGTSGQTHWYVVSGDITINGRLHFKDSRVHLIVCDGAHLTVSSSEKAIEAYKYLTIYGQIQQSGTITANGDNGNYGIYAQHDIIINGCNVTATGDDAIKAQYDFIMNRGTVNATSTTGRGIQGLNVIINGGIVNATGILSSERAGLFALENMTLGWTNPTDRITASSYGLDPDHGIAIKVKDGQTLFNGSEALSGILYDYTGAPIGDLSKVNGKTLRPDLWNVADGNDGSTAEKAYTITTTVGLDQLAAFVNEGNSFNGKFFRLGNDITYSHDTEWDDANSEENNYTAIGGYYNGGFKNFRGTFDGQGKTISGIRIYKSGTTYADSYQGLFGFAQTATIKNVNLADARITGHQEVGGIAGSINGTMENCRVGSDVIIHAVADNANSHGGVVGDCNEGTIRGCVSAATLTVANGLTGIATFGGIVGNLNGNMSDCLAIGATVPTVEDNGAIAGHVGSSICTNCYYRDCTVGADTHQTDAYTVSAGTDVTVAPAGNADVTYDYDGIQRYGDALYYNGVLYAPEAATVSLTLNNTVTPAESFAQYAVAGNLTPNPSPSGEGSYTLTMPAKDVTIIAHLKIPYIDENGVEQICSDYTLLQSSDEGVDYGTDGETHWYVVSDDVTINGQLYFNDSHSHLIVCDGATLTVNHNYDAIYCNSNLTIYSQAGGTGNIDITSSFLNGIYTYHNLTINGCNITCNATRESGIKTFGRTLTINRGTINTNGRYGISTNYDIYINGGTINATGSFCGIWCYDGYFNGGNVCATGDSGDEMAGIFAAETFTLGWTNPTDRIYASSYAIRKNKYGRTLKVKDGQTLFNGSEALSGTIYDYNDGNPIGDLSKVNGKTLRPDLWDVAGGNDGSEEHPYTITTTAGLDQLAAYVNEGNGFKDKFFRLGNDITYSHTTDWNDANSTENNYTAISNSNNTRFRGTFDGQGHTVSGIRVCKGNDNYQGLFGYTSGATIKNVNLADARIIGKQDVGGIVGYIEKKDGNGGIVENCRVGSNVILHAIANNAYYHGGVVGQCNGTIRGCVSAATLTVVSGLTHINAYGGIVGCLYGDMSDCLVLGATVPAVEDNGAIAGYVHEEGGYTHTNNYYHDCKVGNFYNQTDAYTVSAGIDVTMAPAGSADVTYDYDGIQRYGDALYYNGVLYAPKAVTVSLTLGNTVTPAESFVGYHATAGTLSGSENPYTLTMTAKDATIIAKLKVPYIDENGDEQICSDYTLLQSSDENVSYGTDGETHWYVVKDTVDLNDSELGFNDQNAHLILCDGSKLTCGYEVRSSGASLTIYGQSQQSGEIENFIDGSLIWNTNGDITINGGTFNLSGESRISAHGNTTINRGTVNITDYSSILGRNITINGGNFSVIVSQSNCFWASDTITLGWTNPTDRINVKTTYKCSILRVKDGQALANENGNVFSGDITDESKDSRIDIYTLTPALILADDADNSSAIAANNGFDLTLQLADRTLYKDGYWNTLCLPFDVTIEGSVLDGADVRALASADLTNEVLTLNFTPETGEDAVTTIEAGKPYIIRWGTPESNPNTTLEDPVFMNVIVKEGLHNFESTDRKVQFKGNYSPINWTEETPSILFVGAENKLHWPLANAHLNAFRAYFELADGAQARSINLNFGEETSDIVAIDHSQLTIDNEAGAWYDMQGRKVSGKPTTKGMYIHNGRKVVIK